MRALLAAALMMVATATVGRTEEVGTVAGAGWVSCAEFAQRYKESPGPTEDYFYAWAQGYMSGVNQASWTRKNLRGIPVENQKNYIRQHCDKHPLINYGLAVQSLFESLPNR